MPSSNRFGAALLCCLLQAAVPVCAAALEGDAAYRERIVPPADAGRAVTPEPCSDAITQAALNECAYQQFLGASAALAPQLQTIESALSPARRTAWRRQQKAWLTYRTEACQFESGALETGSARPMVQWLCAARMTRQRAADLSRLASCREGETTCSMPSTRKPR